MRVIGSCSGRRRSSENRAREMMRAWELGGEGRNELRMEREEENDSERVILVWGREGFEEEQTRYRRSIGSRIWMIVSECM